MTPIEQKKAAKAFVGRWKAAEGNEQREANKFWIELFNEVLGVANPTHMLDFERKVKGRRIDVFHEDAGVLIESKSRGINLDVPEQRGKDNQGRPRMITPYEQAKWYADNITPRSASPRWIIISNFDEIRIHDLDVAYPERDFETITLDELPEQAHRLTFMVRKENSRAEREKKLSVAAGEVVGRLYDAFAKSYVNLEKSVEEQRSLNILVTRIVFLLYAEDAGFLHEIDAFYRYLKDFKTPHMAGALQTLFKMLKTPEGERNPYMDAEALKFPYVNGGLFAQDIIIPPFSEEARHILLKEASADFDWKDISPTIFGAVFESTLNPETRRAGGMHYTSVENIHKVTGPLFYDALKDELTRIEGERVEKKRGFMLRAFREKLASIKILDPACGSGNFLTETYLSLRKLENRVLENLYGSERILSIDPILVKIDQFYGIEINDFAVSVAKTALWIAELQMLEQTSEIMDMWIEPLPLKSNENIICGNALRMDWNEVLPAEECSYIIGNPPFNGARTMSAEQKKDLQSVAQHVRNNYDLDYVGGWYIKTCDMIDRNPAIKAALVSTNSICQGTQPGDLWAYLLENRQLEILFAYRTFIWNSEATDKAHVHCVIVGFAKKGHAAEEKLLFEDGNILKANNINGYLLDAPDVFVHDRKTPLSDVPEMSNGNQPRDGGHLLMTPEEMKTAIEEEPDIKKFIRPYIGADEFIKGKERYCLWLNDATDDEIATSRILSKRVNAVYAFRMASKAKTTNGYAKTPRLIAQRPQKQGVDFLLIPSTSSKRRFYLPIGYMDKKVVASNSVLVIADATIYYFGILTSLPHNAWMRSVCGRLKSDYRYSKDIVYNNFPWPVPTLAQRQRIEACAQAVLDARAVHEGDSLAQMYDGISPMPENPCKADLKKYDLRKYDDLLHAHKALDRAVEAAYGVDFNGDEEKIVAHLFRLYAEAVKAEQVSNGKKQS